MPPTSGDHAISRRCDSCPKHRDRRTHAEERADGTLLLRRLKGWQPYSEGVVTINLDQEKRWAFTMDYKNGASPPLYDSVNTVTAGFTFKY